MSERIPIENLDFSDRAYNALKKEGINFLDELIQKTDLELWRIRNLSYHCFCEITTLVAEFNLCLNEEPDVEWPYELTFKRGDGRSRLEQDDRPEAELTPMELVRRRYFQLRFMHYLDESEQSVMVQRFGLDGYPRQTLEEVAQQFAITQGQVRQLEVKMETFLRTTTPWR